MSRYHKLYQEEVQTSTSNVDTDYIIGLNDDISKNKFSLNAPVVNTINSILPSNYPYKKIYTTREDNIYGPYNAKYASLSHYNETH